MGQTRRLRRKMRKQTCRRQRGGGKLTFLPFVNTPTPGYLIKGDKVTIENEIKEDILTDWESFVISAHGTLIPYEYFPVPENTYLIFNSPSGCMAWGSIVPYADILVAESEEEFATKLAKEHLRAIEGVAEIEGIDPSMVDNGHQRGPLRGMSRRDTLLRTLAPFERQILKGTMNVKGDPRIVFNKTAGVYPKEFNRVPIWERSTQSKELRNIVTQEFIGKTIYGPGEVYPNMLLEFNSNVSNSFFNLLLGAYRLPIKKVFHQEMLAQNDIRLKIRKEIKEAFKKYSDSKKNIVSFVFLKHTLESIINDNLGFHVELEAMSLEELTREVLEKGLQRVTEINESFFTKENGNFVADYLNTTQPLNAVLGRLPAVEEGKKRFIFITACRGIGFSEAMDIKTGLPVATKLGRLARRLSVAEEGNLNIDRLLEETQRQAKIYYGRNRAPAAAGAAAGAAAARPHNGSSATGSGAV